MFNRFLDRIDLSETFVTRLRPGEDLFERITEIYKENGMEQMVIVSAIGSVKDVEFRDLKTGIDLPVIIDKTNLMIEHGPFELLSLEGNVVPMDGQPVLHLHAILGASYGQVIGGHLFKATIFTTTELWFAKVKGTKVHKDRSPLTGLTEMNVEEKH
jgi:predicted DNA-binding protein with PD1-like motif